MLYAVVSFVIVTSMAGKLQIYFGLFFLFLSNNKSNKTATGIIVPINELNVFIYIVNDAINNFHKWGLKFPKAYQSFSNDPNANYSRNMKNFLGIYDLIY